MTVEVGLPDATVEGLKTAPGQPHSGHPSPKGGGAAIDNENAQTFDTVPLSQMIPDGPDRFVHIGGVQNVVFTPGIRFIDAGGRYQPIIFDGQHHILHPPFDPGVGFPPYKVNLGNFRSWDQATLAHAHDF
jgi:hypothetical protein